MKTGAVTLIKEDVLALGRMANQIVSELLLLLAKNERANYEKIESLEEDSNNACQKIEEKCLDLLTMRQDLAPQEVRVIVGSVLIAAKFERLADHALRVAKYVSWISDEKASIPPELAQMTATINAMVGDVLLCFLTDAVDKIPAIIQEDASVDYLHDFLSKKLLSDLGAQDQEQAQLSTQLLFCTRYLERMGDACTSVAKRIHFIVSGERLVLKDN